MLPSRAAVRPAAVSGSAVAIFPKVGGDLGNKNYSTLKQIKAGNVKRLGGAWHTQLEGGSTAQYQECTVVAQDGVLYVQTTQQNVFAVNGKTGAIVWQTPLLNEPVHGKPPARWPGPRPITTGWSTSA